MKVRITAAEKETYWYAKHIGEEFEVDKLSSSYVLSKDRNAWVWRHIEFSDCEVITEPKKAPRNLTKDPTGDSDMNYSDADPGL